MELIHILVMIAIQAVITNLMIRLDEKRRNKAMEEIRQKWLALECQRPICIEVKEELARIKRKK